MADYSEQLAELFRTCFCLRNGLSELEQKAEHIRETAMNAAVAAGHTGRHMRVFNEIAHQIALTSRQAKTRTAAMHSEINRIVNLNLQALSCSRRMGKFLAAAPTVQRQQNRRLLQEVMTKQHEEIEQMMLTAFHHLYPTESHLKTLMQYQYRLTAALNALKVEATELEGNELSAILSLGEGLTTIAETSALEVAAVLKTLKNIKGQVQQLARIAAEEKIYAQADLV